MYSRSYNCKIQISASNSLNGKLTVEALSVIGSDSYAYMMPNSFEQGESDTIGIYENELIQKIVDGDVISVPSDWSIIISYKTN